MIAVGPCDSISHPPPLPLPSPKQRSGARSAVQPPPSAPAVPKNAEEELVTALVLEEVSHVAATTEEQVLRNNTTEQVRGEGRGLEEDEWEGFINGCRAPACPCSSLTEPARHSSF